VSDWRETTPPKSTRRPSPGATIRRCHDPCRTRRGCGLHAILDFRLRPIGGHGNNSYVWVGFAVVGTPLPGAHPGYSNLQYLSITGTDEFRLPRRRGRRHSTPTSVVVEQRKSTAYDYPSDLTTISPCNVSPWTRTPSPSNWTSRPARRIRIQAGLSSARSWPTSRPTTANAAERPTILDTAQVRIDAPTWAYLPLRFALGGTAVYGVDYTLSPLH